MMNIFIMKVLKTKTLIAEKHEDKLPGGLADDKDPKDFDKDQLEKGIKVEMEHVDDRDLAREIAMDHLMEDSKYYDNLEKCHKEANKWISICKHSAWSLHFPRDIGKVDSIEKMRPRQVLMKCEKYMESIDEYIRLGKLDNAEMEFGELTKLFSISGIGQQKPSLKMRFNRIKSILHPTEDEIKERKQREDIANYPPTQVVQKPQFVQKH